MDTQSNDNQINTELKYPSANLGPDYEKLAKLFFKIFIIVVVIGILLTAQYNSRFGIVLAPLASASQGRDAFLGTILFLSPIFVLPPFLIIWGIIHFLNKSKKARLSYWILLVLSILGLTYSVKTAWEAFDITNKIFPGIQLNEKSEKDIIEEFGFSVSDDEVSKNNNNIIKGEESDIYFVISQAVHTSEKLYDRSIFPWTYWSIAGFENKVDRELFYDLENKNKGMKIMGYEKYSSRGNLLGLYINSVERYDNMDAVSDDKINPLVEFVSPMYGEIWEAGDRKQIQFKLTKSFDIEIKVTPYIYGALGGYKIPKDLEIIIPANTPADEIISIEWEKAGYYAKDGSLLPFLDENPTTRVYLLFGAVQQYGTKSFKEEVLDKADTSKLYSDWFQIVK